MGEGLGGKVGEISHRGHDPIQLDGQIIRHCHCQCTVQSFFIHSLASSIIKPFITHSTMLSRSIISSLHVWHDLTG